MNKAYCIIIIYFIFLIPLTAQHIIEGQFKKGEIIIKKPVIENGKFSFTADSGGCTYKNSFNIKVVKVNNLPGVPHYRLTVERVTPDFCKGMFTDGVKIEFDLEKDCGLKGNYTVSIENKILSGK